MRRSWAPPLAAAWLAVLGHVGSVRAQSGQTEMITFRVEGMHCGACADRIEDVVGRLDGVVSAEVELEQHRARVVYDPRRVSPSRISSAIVDAGFRVSGVVTTRRFSEPSRDGERSARR